MSGSDLSSYPVLAGHVNLRISKGRLVVKNMLTEDCSIEDGRNFLILSLCDGTRTLSDNIAVVAGVYGLQREQAVSAVTDCLHAHAAEVTISPVPVTSRHPADIAKLLAVRSMPWPYGRFREENPYALELILTEQCNHFCTYCYKGSRSRKHQNLPADFWIAVIREAAGLGVQEVTFSGGEPLLYPDLPRLIEESVACGMFPRIATNGTLCSADTIRKLSCSGCEFVHLSLPAITESVFDRVTRTTGHLPSVMQAARNFKKAGFYVRAKMVLIPASVNDVVPVVDFCGREHIDFLHISPFIPAPEIPGIASLLCSPEEYRKAASDAASYRDEHWPDLELALPPADGLHWKDSSCIVKCGGIKDKLTILSDGSITFCDVLGSYPEFILGHAGRDSLSAIWNSDAPDRLTDPEGKNIGEPCADCRYLADCGTGCFAFSAMASGNPWSADPRCRKSPYFECWLKEKAGAAYEYR